MYFETTEGLAEILAQLAREPEAVKWYSAQGRKYVKDHLTLERASQRLWAHIHQVIKEFLAREIREKPANAGAIYDIEHRRNWAYAVDRFDPTWARHWRAQEFISVLKAHDVKTVLDVGCGAVYPTIEAMAGFDVTALDISTECLKQVSILAEQYKVSDKVHTVQGDAAHLEKTFDSEVFDAVIQAEIWEHVPDEDLENILLEGVRVLKPGGVLIASTPVGKNHYDPMHLRLWDDEKIEDFLGKHLPPMSYDIEVKKIAEKGTDPSCYLIVIEKK